MLTVAIVSHAFAAFVFLIVALFSLFHLSTRQRAPWFIVGCFTMSLWGALSSLYAGGVLPSYIFVALLDVLRGSIWCFGLIQLLKAVEGKDQQGWMTHQKITSVLGFLTVILAINALCINDSWWPGTAGKFAKISFLGLAVFAMFGLYLVEQLFRSVREERRWSMSLLCIGFGCLFSFDFYIYTNALLFNRLDYNLWEIRGGVAAIVAPFMAVTAMRNTRWSQDLMPSRKAIFHSTVFMLSGLYLVSMTGVAYVVREQGGSYGQAFQILLIVASILFLLTVLASSRVRAWLKLQISRHLFQYRYDYREEWLGFTKLLAFENNESTLGERIIKAFANLVESSSGALYAVNENNATLKDTWEEQEMRWPKRLPAALLDQCLADEKVYSFSLQKAGMAEPYLALYAEIPTLWLLIPLFQGKTLHAILLLTKPKVAFTLNWEVEDVLEICAHQAAVCFGEDKNRAALACAKQFEGFNRLAAFVMHDIKNVVSQLELIEKNRVQHKDNPQFIESAFRTITLSTQKMQNLLGQLNVSKENLSEQITELNHLLNQILSEYQGSYPQLILRLCENKVFTKADSEKLHSIFCHLIRNAQEACTPDDKIILSLSVSDQQAILTILDTGCGMSLEFIRESLFKPFVSTKGSRNMGIGVFQAKVYIEALGGEMLVESELQKGTTITLILPITQREQHQEVA